MGKPSSAATLDRTETLAFDALEPGALDWPDVRSTDTTQAPFPSVTPSAIEDDVTGIVRAMQTGERAAADRLLTVLYDELRRIARSHLRRERPEHTLNATSLVHEAYLRLVGHRNQNWQNRAHFFGAASRAMRRVLVDHARGRLALKRHAAVRVSLTGCDPVDGSAPVLDEVIAIDAALDRLAVVDERLVRIVDCRYFAGLTIEETAEVLSVSHTTVSDGWRFSRAWLERALRTGSGDAAETVKAIDAVKVVDARNGTRGAKGVSERKGASRAAGTSDTTGASGSRGGSDLELSRRRGWGSAA